MDLSSRFPNYPSCAKALAECGRALHAHGWTPATSSNFSMRIDEAHCAITVSGKHKGKLNTDDIMVVDLSGKPLDARKPSAETLLHTQLYVWNNEINAVLHTHSTNATVWSLHTSENQILFRGYELQKAFPGVMSHDSDLLIPIFPNTQNIPELVEQVGDWLARHPDCPAYLIRGHGAYTWGDNLESCERHLEALEFLINCEMQKTMLRGQSLA